MRNNVLTKGTDCRDQFQSAYENRYAWPKGFAGYKGKCSFKQGVQKFLGNFELGKDFKATISSIEDESIQKIISSQLWEVAIHRVNRPFEQVHGQNTFTIGDTNLVGMEVLVGGKNSGDRYRIKNNIVTMVYRNIHGSIFNIFTKTVTSTANGYISNIYTSQSTCPTTGKPLTGKKTISDVFIPLEDKGPWVLSERVIETSPFNNIPASMQSFYFFDLNKFD